MSKYLVTGGGGFIGSHLVDRLLSEGHEVVVVDNFLTGRRENISHFENDIELHEIDIRDKVALDKAMCGVEYIYHQAALPSVPRSIDNPLTSHEINTTGTLNVLLAARDAGVKRLAFAGSSSTYGDIESEYKSEDLPPRVKSPYAASKVIAEHYCRVFNEIYGLETVITRYFNVFGPRQDPDSPYGAAIPLFIKAMMANKRPGVFGDGTQSRDFTYIENVVHGNRLVMQSDNAPGQTFNIACGNRISLLELLKQLNALMGKSIEPEFKPARRGDVRHSRAAIKKAQQLLGYEPQVNFSDGLARTVAWYEKLAIHS